MIALPASIRPYVTAIRTAAIVALAVAAFVGGCSWRGARDAAAITAATAERDRANDALSRQNEANARAIADAEQRRATAEAALAVAVDAFRAADAARREAENRWAVTGRDSPACALLKRTDITRTCGIVPR